MSEFTRGLAYAAWDFVHALTVLLTLLSPLLIVAVPVALFVKSRQEE